MRHDLPLFDPPLCLLMNSCREVQSLGSLYVTYKYREVDAISLSQGLGPECFQFLLDRGVDHMLQASAGESVVARGISSGCSLAMEILRRM